LKDGHLSFNATCYSKQFAFSQQLALYSVINKDDVQIIKIFNEIDSSTVDCEVTHIDGKPSIEVIKEFADTLRYSKDAGVRFNSALAVIQIDRGNKSIVSNGFASRSYLPEKSSIEYSIVCTNGTKTKFTREWKIGSLFYHAFNTSDDYRNNFCLTNEQILPSNNYSKMFVSKNYNEPMSDDELIHKSITTNFYVMSDNKTGVVVIPTLHVSGVDIVKEMFELQTGFDLFEEKGIKKVSNYLI